MNRLIVTGTNGVGKSHLSARLSAARSIPVVSFDAIKLKTSWRQRSRPEIDTALAAELERPAWILEGGPSLLEQALPKADGLVWLDPPEHIRAWRLAVRPWKHYGKTRNELPAGNIDWPLQQYRFAWRSLKNGARNRAYLSRVFHTATVRKWQCRGCESLDQVVEDWARAK